MQAIVQISGEFVRLSGLVHVPKKKRWKWHQSLLLKCCNILEKKKIFAVKHGGTTYPCIFGFTATQEISDLKAGPREELRKWILFLSYIKTIT